MAVTLLPMAMPRSVLLWFVMMAAIVPPRQVQHHFRVDGARLHARDSAGQLVARRKARPCAVGHEDDGRGLDQRKRFRARRQAQAGAAALRDDGNDLLAARQFQGNFIVDGTLFQFSNLAGIDCVRWFSWPFSV
jgi:hypothetical protein